MISFLVFITAIIAGIGYFVLGQGLWVIVALLVVTLATRFREQTKSYGRFVEVVFLFCLVSFVIGQLGIHFPYSLIIVLASLIMLISLDGPAWGELYFLPALTHKYFKLSLVVAFLTLAVFGIWVFLKVPAGENPVPLSWPLDTLIVMGVGFAFYLAIVEEIIFRSILLERVKSAAGINWAVPIQGTFYGLMHYRSGIPNGLGGVALVSCFGIGLGYLVKKSNSVYLSMLVNFVVTFLVFLELTVLGKA
ncbi:MAG: CPBP family intramembrane glutamic endopeptidase [bacterium]